MYIFFAFCSSRPQQIIAGSSERRCDDDAHLGCGYVFTRKYVFGEEDNKPGLIDRSICGNVNEFHVVDA